jgi:hypothetical protein
LRHNATNPGSLGIDGSGCDILPEHAVEFGAWWLEHLAHSVTVRILRTIVVPAVPDKRR